MRVDTSECQLEMVGGLGSQNRESRHVRMTTGGGGGVRESKS